MNDFINALAEAEYVGEGVVSIMMKFYETLICYVMIISYKIVLVQVLYYT